MGLSGLSGLSGISGVAGGNYRLLDAFTGTNADLLTAHPMTIGAGWAATNGAWEIQGNRASCKTLTSAYALALAESGGADVIVTAIAQRAGASNIGVAFRSIDANNFWVAVFGSANLALIKKVTGTPTVVSSIALSTSVGVDVVLQVVASGTTITVYADGVQKLQATSQTSLQSATKCGIYAEGVGNLIDNFQVV